MKNQKSLIKHINKSLKIRPENLGRRKREKLLVIKRRVEAGEVKSKKEWLTLLIECLKLIGVGTELFRELHK
jgi:hypothetical protein